MHQECFHVWTQTWTQRTWTYKNNFSTWYIKLEVATPRLANILMVGVTNPCCGCGYSISVSFNKLFRKSNSESISNSNFIILSFYKLFLWTTILANSAFHIFQWQIYYNRCWVIIDKTGSFCNQRKQPTMAKIQPELTFLEDGQVQLSLNAPDMSKLTLPQPPEDAQTTLVK